MFFISGIFTTHSSSHSCVPVSGCLGYHVVKVSFHVKIVAAFMLISYVMCSLITAFGALFLSPSVIGPRRNLTM